MKKPRFLALLLALVLVLTPLTGCNKATSARNAVELFQKEMNALNYKAAFAYVADYDGFGFSNSRGVEDIINAVSRSLSIQVINDVSGLTSANIDVRITTIDLRELYRDAAEIVLPEFYSQAVGGPVISENEVLDRMVTQIVLLAGSPEAKTVTTDLTLKLYLDEHNKWLISLDKDSYAAISGYLDEANALVVAGSLITTAPAPTAPTQPASPTDATQPGETEAAGQ